MSCCYHLRWRHQSVHFLQIFPEGSGTASVLSPLRILSCFHLCPCPVSVSLVTINGHFHPFLASVISITAGRGKVVRTPAASKAVVIHKWSPVLSIVPQPPLAARGAAQHQCNAAVIMSVRCSLCCHLAIPAEVFCVTDPSAPAQCDGKGEGFNWSISAFFLPILKGRGCSSSQLAELRPLP